MLRRQACWTQISANLHGSHKGKSAESIRRTSRSSIVMGSGFGGHFRAVQGFRYIGEKKENAAHV